MVTIYIDDKAFQIKEGQNLLQACLSLGFNLPYFCWHPAMGSVGACRQCAVKQFRDEADTKGRIVMACMTPADDGTRISITDPEAADFRASVIEWMMANHPHDCPVCDEGGECHLQDMTVMTGHARRRNRFNKRTHRNQYLGPFINHEMNRCIQCYRCIRFYRDYAGGADFNVFGCHDHVYFGRHREGTLENPFSGNLVEICPTGVFTDKTFKKHFSRSWDLQSSPSICVHCGLGCNTILGERYGQLRRIRNRYNHHVNGYFLCDRGRYGYEFVNGKRRMAKPLQRNPEGNNFVPVSRKAALDATVKLLSESHGVIGIGSPRASLEANFMLRELVGPEWFYAGVSNAQYRLIQTAAAVLENRALSRPSLREAAHCDAVFLLGEDVFNTAPLLALNLRQVRYHNAARTASAARIPGWLDAGIRTVLQQEERTLIIATPGATSLDDTAKLTWRAAPRDLARLGFAIASAIHSAAPPADDLSASEKEFAEKTARMLKQAARPLIVSGIGCGDPDVLHAAFNTAWALKAANSQAGLVYTVPESNSLGLALMGPAGGVETGIEALERGDADTVVILENDLYRRISPVWMERLRAACRSLIVLDHLSHQTTDQADIFLPAAAFDESSGTLVNDEGRAQRYYSVHLPADSVEDSWRWLRDMAVGMGSARASGWRVLDDVCVAMAGSLPVFSDLPKRMPGADFRMTGGRIPRQSHRYSGRTAMQAQVNVHEPKPPEDIDTPLSFSMEGHEGIPPSPLIPRYRSPGWNSVQSLNKFQSEIPGPLRSGDPGVCLTDRMEAAEGEFFVNIPSRAVPVNGRWWLVALYHVFGSEELSSYSAGIAQCSPAPYLGLHPDDGKSMEVAEGDPVDITVNDQTFRLPVRLMAGLPEKVAGLPAGLPGIPVLDLPLMVSLTKGISE